MFRTGLALSAAVVLCGSLVAAEPEGKSLFDGKTLAGWKSTAFGGEGEVVVENGAIIMPQGQDMTGITYAAKEELPKSNYELTYEAQRIDGSDFFAAATFPVKDSHCSLINGGWGGTVVGLSSIDGHDASENETSKYKSFKNGEWYKFRVRVTDAKIECWINEEKVVDAELGDHKISTRTEVSLSQPLGFSTWSTKGAIKNIRIAKIEPAKK